MNRCDRGIGGGLVIAVVALLPTLLHAVPPLRQRETNEFFSKPQVIKVVIDVGKAEADSLRREPRKYVRCSLKVGDRIYNDVGIHLRGAAGSYRDFDDKPGLTLNMDKFKEGQRFHGMDKFHLANSAQDGSYLSELICGELLKNAGVPAARIGHAVVTVNGKLRGMYYLKEGYDSQFLKRHFGNSSGNFYDGGFLREIDQPLDLVSSRGDVADRADLKALVAAANEPDHVKRLAALDKLLETEKFLSYMALAAVMWDWDSYPFKCNNYRVYHHPVTGKSTFVPSGMDQMFADVNGPIVPDFGGLIARKIMETKDGKKRYLVRLKEVMKTAYNPAELLKRLDEYEKVIQPELARLDANAGRDYKHQVNRLRDAIVQRKKVVDEQLTKLAR